jgi:hypothetical protein
LSSSATARSKDVRRPRFFGFRGIWTKCGPGPIFENQPTSVGFVEKLEKSVVTFGIGDDQFFFSPSIFSNGVAQNRGERCCAAPPHPSAERDCRGIDYPIGGAGMTGFVKTTKSGVGSNAIKIEFRYYIKTVFVQILSL